MKNNNQNTKDIQQQSFQNINLDMGRQYGQRENNGGQDTEPVNPFLFNGEENNSDDESSDQPIENVKQVGSITEAGLAISELIASITKPTVSLVLGGGHSIGTALAVSAERSFIAPTGTMTIHPIRTNGFVIGVPQTFRYFQKMQERITNFIVSNSKVNREALLKYMYDTDEIANDVGTVLNADEAVEIGLIDEIGGFSASMNALRQLIDEMNTEN